MQVRHWWNIDLEQLLAKTNEWLIQHPRIEIVDVDWKFVNANGQQRWWMVMFYREPA